MNLRRRTPTDTIGSSTSPYQAVHAVSLFANGTELAKITRPLDQFGTPGDTTDLDATTARHGLMSKLDKQKLDGVASGAQVNPSDAAIAASYAAQVAQASGADLTDPAAQTGVRRFSPANVATIADVRIAATALDGGATVSAVSAATNSTETVNKTFSGGVITYDVRRKTGFLAPAEGLLGSGADGVFVTLGTAANTAAPGNDSRFLTSDERAAITASNLPTAGNPFQTLSGAKTIPLDQFGTPGDTTDLDATTARHGLMSKLDKQKLDGVASGAQVNPSDAAIAASYAAQVAQASGADLTDPAAQTGVRRFSPANVATIADVRIAASLIPSRVILRHSATDGTAGGTATSGSWQTRPMTFEAFDPDGICTLVGNEFTLPAGSYDVFATAQGYQVNGFKLRLYNVGASAAIEGLAAVNGYSPVTASSTASHAMLQGRFTLAVPATLRLEQRVNATRATDGMGIAASLGDPEVYAMVSLVKVA